MKKIKHLWVFFAAVLCVTAALCACAPQQDDKKGPEEETKTVYYSDFGAAGDGIKDDFEAIIKTHEYANENFCKVKADDGAHYYIGAHKKTAVIKTNTDWGTAEFIIDDREVSSSDREWYIFEVASDTTSFKIDVPEGYSVYKGQENLGMTFESPLMLNIVNSNKKDYIRYGKNQNSGSNRNEIILVDKYGFVDESTPVLWDYDTVTNITAYSVTDRALTIQGGTFTTIANIAPVSANYYSRGINVKRSNTKVLNVKHYITGEGETGSPYRGFYYANNACNVTFENCVLTGHKTYTNIKDTGEVKQGTYDTQAVRCNNIVWLNCTQSNDITDTAFWGVMASNFCKNLRMEGSNLSRFDAHQGVYNATIKNTVLGQNLTIIGAGTLTLDNVKRLSGDHFLELRSDYGSTWEGDVIFKDCTMTSASNNVFVIQANWTDHNFGYTCYLPKSIILDNFKLESGGKLYVYNNVTSSKPDAVKMSNNPYVITEKVIIKNEDTPVNMSLNSSGLFANTLIEKI